VITTVRFTQYIMESHVDLFQTIGGNRMVGPLWVVGLPRHIGLPLERGMGTAPPCWGGEMLVQCCWSTAMLIYWK